MTSPLVRSLFTAINFVIVSVFSGIVQLGSLMLSMQYLEFCGVAAEDVPTVAENPMNVTTHARSNFFILLVLNAESE